MRHYPRLKIIANFAAVGSLESVLVRRYPAKLQDRCLL